MDQHFKSEPASQTSASQRRDLDSFTRGFVRKSARQLAGKFGFPRQDREEIEQQLYLKLAKRLHMADATDPKWKAFVAITVRRHIASMIRDREAEKRDHRRVCSLNVTVDTDEGQVELANLVAAHEIPSRRGCRQRSPQEMAELLIDVADCLANLSDARERELCERLQHDSLSQVARDMEIPRTTLHAWIGRLRRRFEERGLREYL